MVAHNRLPADLAGWAAYYYQALHRKQMLVPLVAGLVLFVIWTVRLTDPFGMVAPSAPASSRKVAETEIVLSNATATPSPSPSPIPPPPGGWGPPPVDFDISAPDAPFVAWPVRRVCDNTVWMPGLIFVCDNNSGGLGNIRNYVQVCMRYALEAGATGMLLPKIRKRNPEDLADIITSDVRNFTYFFDEEYFKNAWATACPQITIYDEVENIPNWKPSIEIGQIDPKNYADRSNCDGRASNWQADMFGLVFQRWLQNPENGVPPSAENPRLVRFPWGQLFDWRVYHDGPEFAAAFGQMLKVHDRFLYLGRKAIANMKEFANENGAGNGTFMGIHLRTESDALSFWPNYDEQSTAFLKEAKQRGFRAAYLATGNASEAARFAQAADEVANMKIITKNELLFGEDLEMLQSLSWDQQGLVDYVVLNNCTFFAGANPSSFSMSVALKRHLKTGGLYSVPWKVGRGDPYSIVVAKYERYWDEWLYMYDSLWP